MEQIFKAPELIPHHDDKPVYGHDFKISVRYLAEIGIEKEAFFNQLSEYFSRNIKLLVIGFDTLYLDETNTEGDHYHYRFTSHQTKKTIGEKKGKFIREELKKIGLTGFTHSSNKESALFKYCDVVLYLAYAVKENKIMYSAIIEADMPLKNAIDSAAGIALQKKQKDNNYKKAKDEKIQEKTSQTDQALQYLIETAKTVYLGNLSTTLIELYSILVKYQRINKLLLYNTQMTAIVFRYLQDHTEMDDQQIAILRFSRVV